MQTLPRRPVARTVAVLLGMAIAGAAWAVAPGGAEPFVPAASAASPAPSAVEAVPSDPLARHFPAPSQAWSTPGLAPGRDTFTSHEEIEALLRGLADRGDAAMLVAGFSDQGRPLHALHFSRAPGRPVALVVGQQHGNEPATAEAVLVLAQRLADPADPLSGVLDALDVVLLPRANPDGAVAAKRANAGGLDVNRDHLLLATPEARAQASLARRFEPLLFVDVHEFQALPQAWSTLGLAARHDLLVQFATTPNLDPALARASERWFRAALWQDAQAAGLRVDWYHVRTSDPARLAMGGVQPVLARNAFGLRHAVSVLLESRGSDLGRRHLARRVHTHVVALASLLRTAAQHAGALQGMRIEAAARAREQACAGELVIAAQPTRTRRELTLVETATGEERVRAFFWDSALELSPTVVRPWPCAYWLHASAAGVVQRLRQLGVQVHTLDAPRRLHVARYEPAEAVAGAASGAARAMLRLSAGRLDAAAGDHLVPMDQALAALAAAALEPGAGHDFVSQGLLQLDQMARVERER